MKAIIVLLLGIAVAFSFKYPVVTSQDRMKMIVEIVNSGNVGWKAEYHERFARLSPAERKYLTGTILTKDPILPVKEDFPVRDLPDNFDSRVQWDKCESIKEIRDQSACGSCWAFGAVEAMSDRICIHSKQTLQTRISASDMVACCYLCGFGCNGGYPGFAWSHYKHTGVVTGDLYKDPNGCWPYPFPPCEHHIPAGKYPVCPKDLYPTPKCVKKCQDGYPVEYSKDLHKASKVYSVKGESNMMNEMYENGPIEGSFTVYEDFLSYKSGVYQHITGSQLGGHAIKVIGWGIEEGKKYWICINSWNEDWGEKGQFKILRGTNECGIENGGEAGIPA